MELVPTLISTGWASGVNAYATLLVLGLLGRAGLGTEAVPDQLTETPVLARRGGHVRGRVRRRQGAATSTARWDLAQHRRPAGDRRRSSGSSSPPRTSLDASTRRSPAAVAVALALVSHGVKASLRLGLNASPEPFTNIIASIAEDFAVAFLTAFSL